MISSHLQPDIELRGAGNPEEEVMTEKTRSNAILGIGLLTIIGMALVLYAPYLLAH